MAREPTAWQFSADFDEERRATLSKPGSFADLVRNVVDDVQVIRAIAEPGHSLGLTDCFQPIFFIELPTTGDALFNSSYGYRAQYWLDPWTGLAANAQLLSALRSKLIAAVDTEGQPNLTKLDICSSMEASSAKIWIREAPSTLELRRDLNVEPWVTEADRGVSLATQALSAPSTTKFEVKGALLDPFGHERIPACKIGRHLELHRYGFS